jgi:hypothetical protein
MADTIKLRLALYGSSLKMALVARVTNSMNPTASPDLPTPRAFFNDITDVQAKTPNELYE